MRWLLVLCIVNLTLPAHGFSTGTKNNPCQSSTCFAGSVSVAGIELPLRGIATYRYWGFRVYTAALYAPENVSKEEIANPQTPRALVIHYHHSITAEQFVESSDKILSDMPGINLSAIRTELTHMYGLLDEVSPGDRYTLKYDSSGVTELRLNNVSRGTVSGKQFAAAYFAIWLSEHGLSRDFFNSLFAS